MKQSIVKLFALVFATLLIGTIANAQQATEVKILNQWLGYWESDVVFKSSKWIPEGAQWSEKSEVKWISDRHMHMQLIKNGNDKQENVALQRYNPKSKKYEMWAFSHDRSGYYIGSWIEKSKTMIWKYIDFGVGITGEIVDKFTDVGKWQQTMIFKDKDGNILLDMQVVRKRTKQQTN